MSDDAFVGAWSPIAIVDETRTIHNFITRLKERITEAGSPADHDFQYSYMVFYKEWLTWRDEHGYGDIWGKFMSWNAFWDKLQQYKVLANDWMVKFEKLGGKTSMSLLPLEAKFPWSKLAWGGLIIGGIWAGTKLYSTWKSKDDN